MNQLYPNMNYEKNEAILSKMINVLVKCGIVELAISLALSVKKEDEVKSYKNKLQELKNEYSELKDRL